MCLFARSRKNFPPLIQRKRTKRSFLQRTLALISRLTNKKRRKYTRRFLTPTIKPSSISLTSRQNVLLELSQRADHDYWSAHEQIYESFYLREHFSPQGESNSFSSQSDSEDEDDEEDLDYSIPEQDQRSFFEKFKLAFTRQFGHLFVRVAGYTRTIGISVQSATKQTITNILNILAAACGGLYKKIINLLKKLLNGLSAQISQWVHSFLHQSFPIGRIASYIVVALLVSLVFFLPPDMLNMYARFLLLAMSALIGYFESIYGAAFGAMISGILLKLTPAVRVNANFNIENKFTPQSLDDELSSHYFKNDLKTLMTSILSCVSLTALASAGLEFPKDSKSIDEMLRRHAVLGRAHQTWEMLISKYADLIDHSLRIVTKYIYGEEYMSKDRIEEIETLYREVMALCTLKGNHDIGRDPQVALRVETLYIKMMQLRRVYRGNRTVMQTLDDIAAPLVTMYKRVLEKNPHAQTMRKEPVCIVFYGQTGVGKSYLMTQLQVDLLKIAGRYSASQNLDSMVYSRCFEQEYWDGFMGQPIVIFDDFAQAVDSIANPNIELFELIRTINIFPYQPHCAAIGDKANNPFTSEFVVLTTNIPYFKAKSLYSEEALNRRVHLHFEVSVKPAFQTGTGPYPWTLDAGALRAYREANGLDVDDQSHYVFKTPDGRTHDYVKVLQKVGQQYRKHQIAFEERNKMADKAKTTKLPTGVYSKTTEWIPQGPTIEHQPIERDRRAPILTLRRFLVQSKKVQRQIIQQQYAVYQFMQDPAPEIRFASASEFNDWFWGQAPATVEMCFQTCNTMISPSVLESFFRKKCVGTERHRFSNFEEFSAYYTAQIPELENLHRPEGWYAMKQKLYKMWKSFKDFLSADKFTSIRKWITIISLGIVSFFTVKEILTLTNTFSSKRAHQNFFWITFLKFIKINGLANFLLLLGTPTIVTSALASGLFYGSIVKDALAHDEFHAMHLSQSEVCLQCNEFETWKKNVQGTLIWQEFLLKAQYGQLDREIAELFTSESTTHEMKKDAEKQLFESTTHEMAKDQQKQKLESATHECVKDEKRMHLELDETIQKLFPESGRASGDVKRKKLSLQGVFSHQASNLIDKVRRNQWQILLHLPTKVVTLGSIFVLKGHVALINFHYLERMAWHLDAASEEDRKAAFLEVKQHNMESGHYMTQRELVESLKRVQRGTVNTEFYSFKTPVGMPAGSDMTKHLVRAQDLSKLSRGIRVQLVTYEKTNSNYDRTIREGNYVGMVTATLPSLREPGCEVDYPQTLKYMMSSKEGDCGSPLVLCNDQFERKIVGFHIAGSAGFGTSSIVTVDDVSVICRRQLQADDICLVQPQAVPDNFPLKGSFQFIGKAAPPAKQPLNTKIQPSLVQGKIGPVTTLPSAKAPALAKDGPMLKGVHKYSQPCAILDEFIVEKSVRSYSEMLAQFPALEVERKIMTDEQMIYGIPGNEFFPPVKRNKSAGWPHSFVTKGKGKQPWIAEPGDAKAPLYDDLMTEVREMEEKCKKGIVPETYFVDTLKDEKRPIAKVKAGKTRVFAASNLPFTLLVRKYFMGFLAFMMRTRIQNECAVGVNATSKEWEEIVRHLDRFGSKSFIAGDFGNFDGTVNIRLFIKIVQIINDFYADGELNARVRQCLWEAIAKSKHILDEFVYELTHGQPSGNPTTAVTNSVYNSLGVRYCWFLICGLAAEFNKYVKMLAYGDDHEISVHPAFRHIFNAKTLAEAFKKIGMEYTSEAKDEQDEAFRNIEETTFLKRAFSYDPNTHHWFAPLAVDSIRESCNWITKSPDPVQATIDNCEDAIIELYHHDEETFNLYAGALKQALVKECNYVLSHYDYHLARRLIAMGRGKELHSYERVRV